MNQSLNEQEKQKYSFSVSAGTTNMEEPIEGIDYEVIAYDLDSVIEWCKENYDMSKLEEINSDELSVIFEYVYTVNEDMKEVEDPEYDNETEELAEGFYNMRDVVEIYGSELSEEDYKYMKQGYHRTVVDLTEDN